MKKILQIIAIIACASSAASAADMPVYRKAPPATVNSWTGFYAGLNVGYGWEDPATTFTSNDPTSSFVFTGGAPASLVVPGYNIQGITGGAQVGYNYQFDQRWVAGIEADFSGSGMKGDGGINFFSGGFGATRSLYSSEKVDWFGTVRGRLGFLATPDLLVFGTGGFAYGNVKQYAAVINPTGTTNIFGIGPVTVTCSGNGAACYSGSSSKIAAGWTAGGGLEYALSRNWTVKGEYLYVNLGTNSFAIVPGNITGGTSSFTASFSDTHFNLVRIGANYRF